MESELLTGKLLDMVRKGEQNTNINELGNLYTNIYSVYYKIIDGLSFPCMHCNNMQKYKHLPETRIDTYIWCQDCYENEENDILKELELHCHTYDFDIQHCTLNDYEEKYKIKINDYYGILQITFDEESNSWSREPKNIYVSTYYLFSDILKRDEYYESV